MAVAELAPEILEIPISLGYDDPKAFERRARRPDIAGELVITFGIERDQEHVVNRQERPDQQHDAEDGRGRFGENPSRAVAPTARWPAERGDAHNWTSVAWTLRISTITSGISTGRADNITATPSSGWPRSNAWRMPSVASTSVDIAGAPPETKYATLKSPSVQIVESSVHTR